MAYNAQIPQATDQLSQSQADLLANFQALQTIIDINHVDFASGDQGKHKWVTFPVQGAAPVFAAGEVGMYNLLSTVTAIDELFLNKIVSGGAAVQIPMTSSILSTNAAPAVFTAGWSYLPSGMIIKWAANIAANGLTVINFPVAANIPVFTTCMTVLVQIADGGAGDVNRAVILKAVNPGNFSVYGSNRTTTGAAAVTFTYFAIGY